MQGYVRELSVSQGQRQAFEMARKKRNQLFHRFLPYWQPDSTDQLTNTSTYLDEQLEKIQLIGKHLNFVAETMNRAGK